MHDHDLDLIASLADGSLDDQSEARARVESCQECRLEYQAQVSVLGALARTESASLTEVEKAALHRDLWTELRKEPARRASPMPWWYRLSYAAAGLFVVAGLVTVVNQWGVGGDTATPAESYSEVSSGLDEGTTADAAAAPTPTGGQSESATETTMAAAGDGTPTTPTTPTTSGSASTEAADFEALAVDTRLQQLPPTVRTTATPDQAACLSRAGVEDHQVIGSVDLDRTYLIAVPAGVDLDAQTPVTFVDAETCQVVHVEE